MYHRRIGPGHHGHYQQRTGPGAAMDNPFLAFPGYLLRRAAISRLAQLSQHLEPLGIGVSEASILVMIGRNPGLSQAECGRSPSIKRPISIPSSAVSWSVAWSPRARGAAGSRP
jgi:hypothetical protein